MLIPSPRQRLLRQYEKALTTSKYDKESRVYALYVLLKPILGWLKDELVKSGLEDLEAESEIFIMVAKLLQSYDNKKSSIVPYLQKYLPWRAGRLIDTVSTEIKECPAGLLKGSNRLYEMSTEPYLSVPDILFEERFLGKKLQRSDKYLIFLMLSSDDDEITQAALARKSGIERKKLVRRLSRLRKILEAGGYDEYTE